MRNVFPTVALALLFMTSPTFSFSAELAKKENSQVKFEYEVNNEKAQKLEMEVAKIKKGISLEVVKGLLGQPDSEQILHTKQLVGGGKFVAKQITYVLKRVHVKEDNINDHVISLYFDKKNLLTDAERLGYSRTGSYELLGGVQIREKIF